MSLEVSAKVAGTGRGNSDFSGFVRRLMVRAAVESRKGFAVLSGCPAFAVQYYGGP